MATKPANRFILVLQSNYCNVTGKIMQEIKILQAALLGSMSSLTNICHNQQDIYFQKISTSQLSETVILNWEDQFYNNDSRYKPHKNQDYNH